MPNQLILELDEHTFTRLRDRIEAHCGIFLDDSRRRSLGRTLATRLGSRGLRDWSDYLALLDSPTGPKEITALLEDVVNNETTFFRNPRHFRLLAEVVLPELDRARPVDFPVRIWSAGCSTGQEPYSLAITVAEVLGLPPRRPVQILATDISQRALHRARQGLYTARELARVEPAYLKRYFEPDGTNLRVKPALQELIQFQELNLMATPLPALARGVDVVFCRNVTIYFQVETSRRLMGNLYNCLNEGGYLFIGFSETLWQIFDSFERVQNGGVFYYRKGHGGFPRGPAPEAPRPRSIPGGSSVERPLFMGTVSPEATPPASKAGPVAPDDPARVHYHQGMECLRNGAYETALQSFRAALREEPNLVEAYCGMAQVHANQGHYAEALKACERALELDDLAEEAYLLRGLVYRQMDQTEEAIADLERAAYLNPSSPTAHFYLGNIFMALPDAGRAAQAFRRTRRALLGRTEDALIDGVPVHLLREACRRNLEMLEANNNPPLKSRGH
jgi:chemotaxis protein methyltransferase CheR